MPLNTWDVTCLGQDFCEVSHNIGFKGTFANSGVKAKKLEGNLVICSICKKKKKIEETMCQNFGIYLQVPYLGVKVLKKVVGG